MPQFSIAIPVYNRGKYLRHALRSCFAQTITDFEIVVSDDCSSDDLQSVINEFSDPRIKYSRSAVRLGAAKNHQRAVELSSGNYVLNLHSDDFLLPNCLEEAGKALDKQPSAAAVYFANAYLRNMHVEGASLMPGVLFASAASIQDNPWLERFYGTCPSACLFRRANFDGIGGYNTALRFAYDWYLYRRFLKNGGGVIFLPKILSVYRQHEEQCVQTSVLSAVCDMMDLWRLEENRRWPAPEIAALVIAECRASWRAGKGTAGIIKVFNEVWIRALVLRVLSGVPGAVLQKLRSRFWGDPNGDQSYYIEPDNLSDALESGNAFVRINDAA